jgi:hypothetical protein
MEEQPYLALLPDEPPKLRERSAPSPSANEGAVMRPGGSTANPDIDTTMAWQRIIRDRKAEEYGPRSGPPPDISTAIVKPISRVEAKTLIEEYEWLGKMPAVCFFYFGIFFDGELGGAVAYGPDYAENLGRWDKYGFTGRLILLSRGACTYWAHPHAGTKLIRQSMKQLPVKYEVVTATVDPKAGEVGTIYQAAGFIYAPLSFHGSVGILHEGKKYTSRFLHGKYGKGYMYRVEELYPGGVLIKEEAKGRYWAFRGSPKVQAKHLAALADKVRPAPRRH